MWKRFAISYRDRIIEMWEEKKSKEFFSNHTEIHKMKDNFILKYVFEIWPLKCGNVSNTI